MLGSMPTPQATHDCPRGTDRRTPRTRQLGVSAGGESMLQVVEDADWEAKRRDGIDVSRHQPVALAGDLLALAPDAHDRVHGVDLPGPRSTRHADQLQRRIGPGTPVEKIDHSSAGGTSPPPASVRACTTWENSICGSARQVQIVL